MDEDKLETIRLSTGVSAVFFAAKWDSKIVDKFFHMEGQFLLFKDGRQVTKRQLADVMVYMSAIYDKNITLEECELGLLAAAKEYGEMDGQNLNEVEEPAASQEPVQFVEDEPDDDQVVEMESTVTDDSDWVTDDYQQDAPTIHPSKGKPGVKPDDEMIQRMTTGEYKLTRDDIHISTLDLALRFYDFIGNDLARPETDKGVQHKVKLALGSTMKSLGWKKRMRKGEWGWHPIDDSFFDADGPQIDADSVVLRKRDMLIEPEDEAIPSDVSAKVIADVIPKLSQREGQDSQSSQEQLDPDDDLPWIDQSEMDEFTDGQPERKKETVRFVDMVEGTEENQERELVFGQTYTFFLDDNGIERMVEWDKDEGAWTFYIEEKAV